VRDPGGKGKRGAPRRAGKGGPAPAGPAAAPPRANDEPRRATDPGGAPDASAGLTQTVGANLRRLRLRRGLSLERLAEASGVSRSMLGQIELGQSAPTVNVVWKIARALDVPFSALLSDTARSSLTILTSAQSKRLASADGAFVSRALFPYDLPRRVEFYELRLQPGGTEEAVAHAPGTHENLVVSSGRLEMTVAGERHLLEAGDAILFAADVAHRYHNPGEAPAILYLVMTYADEINT
jgi:transcriptional regulator with XRE-family HTH domain